MRIIESDDIGFGRKPIKIWADQVEIDARAIEQMRQTGALPFVFRHLAVMPDAHWGIGATVGTVLATEGALIPAAVGVDIGCGMAAAKLNIPAEMALDHAAEFRSWIEAAVPVAHNGHATPVPDALVWDGWRDRAAFDLGGLELVETAMRQLGTLGGGNHFIEISLDEGGGVWLVLHSGSRRIGKELASRHIDNAKNLHAQIPTSRLPHRDLAYLTQNGALGPAFSAYMKDMLFAQDYAALNRKIMVDLVLRAIGDHIGRDLVPAETINCHHNFAALEHHFGRDVWVTRKGAVRARATDFGIIPGSMGARSYIVRGKGHAESFCSCAHGAGRAMGRKEAQRRFTVADLEAQTRGVECRKDAGVLDELPSAYKDIDAVMASQADLVEVIHTLKQVVCVKG